VGPRIRILRQASGDPGCYCDGDGQDVELEVAMRGFCACIVRFGRPSFDYSFQFEYDEQPGAAD
jgi:hypothetical protein